MPRYYFHCKEGNCCYMDDEGVDLPDLAAARAFVQEFVRSAKAESCLPVTDWSRWVMEVTDETGRSILLVPFAMVHAGSPSGRSGRLSDAGT